MNEKLLHTPEGVRDIYDDEMKKKQTVVERLLHELHLFGYQDIETPAFEYFDIFNIDKGSAPSNEMFKFFDRNNNTLVLRPDITPSIARSAAKYYADEELPLRLCYHGHCFKNAHQHRGALAEFTQVGGELINDDSSASDAEIIACVIRCLLATGLTEFQIEIGDVGFFKGVIDAAGLDGETEDKIRDYIHIKNFYGLSEYVSKLSVQGNIKKALSSFDNLFGGIETLDTAEALVTNETSKDAIARMKRVSAALNAYGYGKYISFDLSMINRYNYYTGICFRGYTYGTGDAVVKGGRYNRLLEQFGKEAPSVGFAIYVDDLMSAIARNKVELPVEHTQNLILFDREQHADAIALASKLRGEGQTTMMIRKSAHHTQAEYEAYARKRGFARLVCVKEDGSNEILDICAG